MKRYLILEDGTVFPGVGFGSSIITTGQLVISNNRTGIEQSVTDPDAEGQILAFAIPSIGSSGINRDFYESINSQCKGVVIGSSSPSTIDGSISFGDWIASLGIPGIKNVDVRELSKHIAEHGEMKASIMDTHDEHAIDQIKALVLPPDLVKRVSTRQSYPNPNMGIKIVVVDLGLKYSILRQLSYRDCNSVIVNYNATPEEIENLHPDGIIFSNGPGSPSDIPQTIKTIKALQKKYPILGIGLGNLLIALANDCKIIKLAQPHHESSLAVKEVASGKIDFVNHNHSYTIDQKYIGSSDFIVTNICVADGSIEGIRHEYLPIMCVLFEPEAAPGPNDGYYVFDEFLDLIDSIKFQDDGGVDQW
ncbi:carbamoyl phosphate synthase small subunit [Companilactobacillus nodensis]|uniref:carbamoyl-phosphate synthase (glutamine-hydrolyzing) n=1 Tax=Companilactobacillus nodensis DSM 19682 = JCM 14932 = NBRC 107160 TaxID=1423775 RepID=A0A0R1KAX6_9LACO|nr:carbamoyl phosphate synthase small subunit [Companilactobacillus nodensis]KRK80523.1 carbamoyl phosphate synthase small subunit [Companilactobacillus nodensis DSM 19682 = JCM 14932 = NBRC 107160]